MIASLFYLYYIIFSESGIALSDTIIRNHFFFRSLQIRRVKVHPDELEKSEINCYWKQIWCSAFFFVACDRPDELEV